MKSVSTATAQFTMRDDGIVVGTAINPDVPRTALNVTEAFDELHQLVGSTPRPGLWDARLAPSFPPEAWKALIRRLPDSISAFGIVADRRARRGVGAFPAAIDTLLIPVRVFDTEVEATSWLLQFVESEPGD